MWEDVGNVPSSSHVQVEKKERRDRLFPLPLFGRVGVCKGLNTTHNNVWGYVWGGTSAPNGGGGGQGIMYKKPSSELLLVGRSGGGLGRNNRDREEEPSQSHCLLPPVQPSSFLPLNR